AAGPAGPVAYQPAGSSRSAGHSEYCSSSLATTRNTRSSSSNTVRSVLSRLVGLSLLVQHPGDGLGKQRLPGGVGVASVAVLGAHGVSLYSQLLGGPRGRGQE